MIVIECRILPFFVQRITISSGSLVDPWQKKKVSSLVMASVKKGCPMARPTDFFFDLCMFPDVLDLEVWMFFACLYTIVTLMTVHD